MKKILALVLAVAMLSTVAFAANQTAEFKWGNVDSVVPGSDLTIGASNFFMKESTKTPLDGVDVEMPNYEFTGDNFTVTAKWKKGADLVKSVAFDDVEVKITLKDSTSLIAPVKGKKAANVVLDTITVKAKRTIKSGSDYQMKAGNTYIFTPDNAEVFVGYAPIEKEIDDAAILEGKLVKVLANGKLGGKGDVNKQVETVSYEAGTNFMLEGKVYVGDKIFFKSTTKYSDAAKELAKANEDATIEYTKITLDGLSASHKIVLSAEKDQKVYKLVDGKLAPSGLTWNEDEYGFVGKIRSTTEYVVSDIELKGVTTGGSETTNPDTGANDVVGIAAALAVVSLVAAGAVSLKK